MFIFWYIIKVLGYCFLCIGAMSFTVGLAMLWYEYEFSKIITFLVPFSILKWIISILTLVSGYISISYAEKKLKAL